MIWPCLDESSLTTVAANLRKKSSKVREAKRSVQPVIGISTGAIKLAINTSRRENEERASTAGATVAGRLGTRLVANLRRFTDMHPSVHFEHITFHIQLLWQLSAVTWL